MHWKKNERAERLRIIYAQPCAVTLWGQKPPARQLRLRHRQNWWHSSSLNEREWYRCRQTGELFIVCLFIFVRARVCACCTERSEVRGGRISTAPLCDWILNGRGDGEREREREVDGLSLSHNTYWRTQVCGTQTEFNTEPQERSNRAANVN